MRYLISVITLFFILFQSSFAYVTTDKDEKLLDKLEVLITDKFENNKPYFYKLSSRIDELLLKLDTETRAHVLLSRISKHMDNLIVDEIVTSTELSNGGLTTLIDTTNISVSQSDDDATQNQELYTLIKVIDGDTVELQKKGSSSGSKTYRLIGVDAPETSALRFGHVEDYASESKEYLIALLGSFDITVEYDDSQGKIDAYKRDLVYLFIDGRNINKQLIQDGFAKEYTYDKPYKYQTQFLQAQTNAQSNKAGIWTPIVSPATNTSKPLYQGSEDVDSNGTCDIKGNISSKGVKIYHFPGCASYTRTKISPSKGEKYFCTQEEAKAAGWRIAGNC